MSFRGLGLDGNYGIPDKAPSTWLSWVADVKTPPPPFDMTDNRSEVQYELGCSLVTSPREELSPPAPRDKYARWNFNILQINIAGLQYKEVELKKMLSDKNINLTKDKPLTF